MRLLVVGIQNYSYILKTIVIIILMFCYSEREEIKEMYKLGREKRDSREIYHISGGRKE